jgi:hypothetical protein
MAKVGRPKGSGGKQPNWQFTAARKQNLKKARRVNASMRKRAGVGVIKSQADKVKFDRARKK